MLRFASIGQRRQSWLLAMGVCFANVTWALMALVGLLPWLAHSQSRGRPFFLLLAAAVTCWLGIRALRDAGRRMDPPASKHKWVLAKGYFLGLAYPVTFGSWIIVIASLRRLGWGIPIRPLWLVLFSAAVFLGYLSYLSLLHLLYRRILKRKTSQASHLWRMLPGILMIGFSLLFTIMAIAGLLG